MAITRIKNSSIASNGPKYDNALAGLPYRPTIGTATDGGTGTTVSVAFTENNSAGAGITYTALSTPGSLTGTGSSSPVTVSGLTTGTAYTFQVKAGNSLGDSAYSASSNSVTPISPSSYESIATATGTGSSGAITFSSIPSTFKHLQIRFIAKDTYTAASDVDAIYLRFNSDGATNYTRHLLAGDGSSATASGVINMTGAWVPRSNVTSAAGVSNTFGVGIIDILNYNSTTNFKTVRSLSGSDTNGTASPNDGICVSSALWRSTSAITSISIYSNYSNAFTTTSQFALYGIKEF